MDTAPALVAIGNHFLEILPPAEARTISTPSKEVSVTDSMINSFPANLID